MGKEVGVAMGSSPSGRWAGVRRRLARVEGWVVQVETVASIALLIAILVAVLAQVVMRYVFERPNPWTEELSRFAFIWLSLIGASLATRNGAHFTLDSVVAFLSPTAHLVVERIVTLIVAALLGGVVVVGTLLANDARLERSPALDVPMIWVYAALPLSAALMLLHLVARAMLTGEREPLWPSH